VAGYEVTVNNPAWGKGTEVEIPGLGLVKNGETVHVDAEQAEAFKAYHTSAVALYYEDTPEAEGELAGYANEPGRTVLEAFKHTPYVTVATTGQKNKKDKPEDKNENEDKSEGGDE